MSQPVRKKYVCRLSLLLFVNLLMAALGAVTAMSETEPLSTGIEGTFSISPTHGGPTREGESDSAPLAKTDFEVTTKTGPVTTFTTDGSGHFRIPLAPGVYFIKRKGAMAKVGQCGPFEVEVTSAGFKRGHWECDSGLR
jgi:hypothetical protein